jgi:hypothetical protein
MGVFSATLTSPVLSNDYDALGLKMHQSLLLALTYFVKGADASGKTKAINPTCAAAQEKMKTVSS